MKHFNTEEKSKLRHKFVRKTRESFKNTHRKKKKKRRRWHKNPRKESASHNKLDNTQSSGISALTSVELEQISLIPPSILEKLCINSRNKEELELQSPSSKLSSVETHQGLHFKDRETTVNDTNMRPIDYISAQEDEVSTPFTSDEISSTANTNSAQYHIDNISEVKDLPENHSPMSLPGAKKINSNERTIDNQDSDKIDSKPVIGRLANSRKTITEDGSDSSPMLQLYLPVTRASPQFYDNQPSFRSRSKFSPQNDHSFLPDYESLYPQYTRPNPVPPPPLPTYSHNPSTSSLDEIPRQRNLPNMRKNIQTRMHPANDVFDHIYSHQDPNTQPSVNGSRDIPEGLVFRVGSEWVRAEELALVILVLLLWFGAITMFFNR